MFISTFGTLYKLKINDEARVNMDGVIHIHELMIVKEKEVMVNTVG